MVLENRRLGESGLVRVGWRELSWHGEECSWQRSHTRAAILVMDMVDTACDFGVAAGGR